MDPILRQQILNQDRELSSGELDDKYNLEGDGEHPVFTRGNWREQVSQHATLRGYWDWVASMIEQEF